MSACICGQLGPLIAAVGVTVGLAACDLRWSGDSLWGGGRPRLGPRIVQLGQPVPKGGGVYKVGEPYHAYGRVYVPREVNHYDERGIASWYGELFHGRRTANGEIYDMEALSAAHPTLPLPSYVRVTNLQNGRSLVVRVNDRGPYANDRVIDLSWAVASLLQMRDAGTAPVRVQYLGPAPLSGDDGYERAMLARQPWAGPRVAYAASPAKAMYYRRFSHADDNIQPQPSPTSVPHLAMAESSASGAANSTLPPPPVPFPQAHRQRQVQTIVAHSAAKDMRRRQSGPVSTAAMGAAPHVQHRASATDAVVAPHHREMVNRFAGFYVEAGVFSKPELAHQLAEILNEIAPTSVEPVASGAQNGHRLRLGPFKGSDEAKAALARIRAAGLVNARMETVRGG